MTIHKRLIFKWLTDFVSVICQLSEPSIRISVMSGQSVLKMPVDIFDNLRRRRVIEHAVIGDFHFFKFNDGSGDAVVTVVPDAELKTGLVLTTDDVKR